jgi:hypothetical protein
MHTLRTRRGQPAAHKRSATGPALPSGVEEHRDCNRMLHTAASASSPWLPDGYGQHMHETA